MFGRFLSINPPEPELLIDISREHKANSDYSDTGYPYIHNYGSKGGGAAYACSAANLKSPELYYNPWRILRAEVGAEYQELKTGVFHITKLPAKPQFNLADISCDIAKFKGFGSKLGIFISSDKPFVASDIKPRVIIMDGANGTNYQGAQKLNAGMNIWDLTNVPVNSNPEESRRGAYLSFPNSWWDVEEDGTPAITPCDIYLVFFPVLDESQCNGYGEYLIPKFNVQGSGVWTDGHSDIVSPDGLTVDMSGLEHSYDFRYQPQSYYEDDSIVVFSPIFSCFENSVNSWVSVSTHGYTSDGTEHIVSYETIGSCNGFNVSYYGSAFLKGEYTSYYIFLTISGTSVVRMLPYNNDRFAVQLSNDTNNYARLRTSETEPFHDKSELQTLICKCRNTLSGSNSLLYRNEVQPPSQKIGLYGIRFATTSETVTDNSFKACLTDGGLATPETRKSIVSYLDGRVLETNDYGDYELLYEDIIMSVVLLKNEITDEDCIDTGSLLFATRDAVNCFSGWLYYLTGFKERLTPWQIAYYIKQMN